MKMGGLNYSFIVTIGKELHWFTELYTEWFRVCLIITSKFRTIIMFRRFVKKINNSDKTWR
jgi:hypothetical protein